MMLMSEMWMDTGSSVYLSFWRPLQLRGGELLEQLGGGKRRHRLQLLGIGFGRHVLLLVRVLEAVFGEVDDLEG
jgi:hypothetical protein